MSDGHGIPAAWYPDPADARRQRYWDGAGWTQQLRDVAPAITTSPAIGAATATTITDFTGYDRIGQSASYVPLTGGMRQPGHAQLHQPTGGTSTLAIWLYVLVPLLLLVHQYFSWEFTADDFVNLLIHGGIALLTIVLALLLASIDRRQLQDRGFMRTPPAIVGLLPPIHLLARVFRTGVGAAFVALAGLVVQILVVIVLVGMYAPAEPAPTAPSAQPTDADGMTAPFTDAQLAYLLTSEGMEQKILFDAEGGNLNYQTVACESLQSTELGAQTTCHATARLASYQLLIQVIPDGDNTPFTVVSVTPVME